MKSIVFARESAPLLAGLYKPKVNISTMKGSIREALAELAA